MSRKSSLPQDLKSVSVVLTPDTFYVCASRKSDCRRVLLQAPFDGPKAFSDFVLFVYEAMAVPAGTPLLFMCRSGVRSHNAATAATQAGFAQSINVLQGFEGDKDPLGQRNNIGGWRKAGLPWTQS